MAANFANIAHQTSHSYEKHDTNKTLCTNCQINTHTNKCSTINPQQRQKTQAKAQRLLDTNLAAIQDNTTLPTPITHTELTKAIKHTQKNKSPSPQDEIPNEAYKEGGPHLRAALTLTNLIYIHEIPEEWLSTTIIPIYKNNNQSRHEAANYRPISLTKTFTKIFEKILDIRIRAILKHIICESQGGYKEEIGSSEQVWILLEIFQRAKHNNEEIHAAKVDLSKTFDRTPREDIYMDRSKKRGNNRIPPRSYKEPILQSKLQSKSEHPLLRHPHPKLRSQTRIRPITNSLILYMNYLQNSLNKNPEAGIQLYNKYINCLIFVDDVLILAPTVNDLHTSLNNMMQFTETHAAVINMTKSSRLFGREDTEASGSS